MKKILSWFLLIVNFNILVGCLNDVKSNYKNNIKNNFYDVLKKNVVNIDKKIFDNVFYQIAIDKIGSFEEIKLIVDGKMSKNEIIKFVKNHNLYGIDNEFIKNFKLTKEEQLEISIEKIKIQYESITQKIFEELFNVISSKENGKYLNDGLFYEDFFIENIKNECYIVDEKNNFATVKNKILMKKKNVDNWKDFVDCSSAEKKGKKGYLHVTDSKIYDDYIKKYILPIVYNKLMTRDFIIKNYYSKIINSNARKINILSIPFDEKNNGDIFMLIKDCLNRNKDINFIDYVMSGFIGIDTSSDAYNLLVNNNFKKIKTVNNYDLIWECKTNENGDKILDPSKYIKTYVFEGTRLGNIVNEYLNTHEIFFDGKNFIHKCKNFNIEKRKIDILLLENMARTKQFVKNKLWVTKDNLNLDVEFSNKLFSSNIADIIDNDKKKDEYNFTSDDYAKYLLINNSYKAFLIQNFNDDNYDINDMIILNDSVNKKYNVIEIEEAVSSSKLSLNSLSDKSYINKNDNIVKNIKNRCEIINNIAETFLNNTYINESHKYYLAINNVCFNDKKIFNFFKLQFPDLFKKNNKNDNDDKNNKENNNTINKNVNVA